MRTGNLVHDFTAFLIGRPFGVHFIVQIYKEKKIYLVDENYSKILGIYLFHRSVRVHYRKELYRCPNRLKNFVDEQVLGDADDAGNFHLKKKIISKSKLFSNFRKNLTSLTLFPGFMLHQRTRYTRRHRT